MGSNRLYEEIKSDWMWSQNYRKVVPCQILWRWLTSVGKDLPSIRWAQDEPHLSHVLTTGQRRMRTTCLTFQERVQESTFSTFFAQRFVSSLFLLHFWHPRVSHKCCSETLSLSPCFTLDIFSLPPVFLQKVSDTYDPNVLLFLPQCLCAPSPL